MQELFFKDDDNTPLLLNPGVDHELLKSIAATKRKLDNMDADSHLDKLKTLYLTSYMLARAIYDNFRKTNIEPHHYLLSSDGAITKEWLEAVGNDTYAEPLRMENMLCRMAQFI